MQRRLVLPILVLLSASLLAVAQEPPPVTTIEVGAAGDGRPVAGALVSLLLDEGWASERTDDAGRVSLPHPGAGRHTLYVRARGFVSAFETRRWKSSSGETIQVALEPGLELRVRVVSKSTGKPLAGAEVEVILGGADEGAGGLAVRPPLAKGRTDDRGWYTTREIPANELVTAIARAEMHEGRDRSITLPGDGGPTELKLTLAAAGKIAGTVLAPDGGPVAGAEVFLLHADASSSLRINPRHGFAMMMRGDDDSEFQRAMPAETDAKGRFVFASVPFGRPQVLMADYAGFALADWCDPVEVRPDQAVAEVTLKLRQAANLRVILKDEAGAPVEAAPIRVSRVPSWSAPSYEAESDQHGIAILSELPPGPLQLRVRVKGFLLIETPLELREGEQRRLEVVLSRGQRVTGRVVDDLGQPVVGALVKMQQNPKDARPESRGRTRSGSGGAFDVGPLRAGAHEIRVSISGHDDLILPVEVPSPAPLRLELLRLGSARIRLVPPEGGEVPEELEVWFRRANPRVSGSADIVVEGSEVRIEGVAPGHVELEFTPSGYAPFLVAADVSPGGIAELGKVALSRGAILQGLVRDEAGRPVAGAEITLSAGLPKLSVFLDTVTDEAGMFRFAHLPPGEAEIEIEAEGFLVHEEALTIDSLEATIISTLSRGGTIRGAVGHADGSPLPGHIGLRILKEDGHVVGEEYTEEDGTFLLRLPPGRYTVEIHPNTDKARVLVRAEGVKVVKDKETPLRLFLPE